MAELEEIEQAVVAVQLSAQIVLSGHFSLLESKVIERERKNVTACAMSRFK